MKSPSKTKASTPHRVLLKVIPVRSAHLVVKGQMVFTRDASPLKYMVEELISLSATSIIIPQSHPLAEYLHLLPKSCRPWIETIDTMAIRQKLDNLLSPIYSDLGVIRRGTKFGFSAHWQRELIDYERQIYDFMIGSEFRLGVELDVAKLRRLSAMFRDHAKRDYSRTTLSCLEGIFNCYDSAEFPTLRVTPDHQSEILRRFHELIKHSEYLSASKNIGNLGSVSRKEKATAAIHRALSSVAKDPKWRGMFTLASKLFTFATNIPLPGTSELKDILSKGYFPPIVEILPAITRATERCEKEGAQHIPMEGGFVSLPIPRDSEKYI